VKTIMSEGGAALMAVGRASGEDRSRKAAEEAISSSLLDVTIDGARGILFNVTGGPNMSLFEVNEAAAIIKETAHPDVNLIFGAVIDENMADDIRITVIATGFEQTRVTQRRPVPTSRERRAVQPAAAPRPVARQAEEQPVEVEAEADAPQQQAPQQPARRVEEEFTSRVYDTDDLDIPAFLRRR
jgi:cell division protein FtsZ